MRTKIIVIAGLLFVVIIALVWILLGVNKRITPQQNDVTTTPTTEPFAPIVIKGDVVMQLLPAQTTAKIDDLVKVQLAFANVTKSVVATDIILSIDPEYLEFVNVENVNPDYINPRKLAQENKIILSFEQKLGVTQSPTNSAMTIATVVFKAKKQGATNISPDFATSKKSSLVYLEGENENALKSVIPASVVIQ